MRQPDELVAAERGAPRTSPADQHAARLRVWLEEWSRATPAICCSWPARLPRCESRRRDAARAGFGDRSAARDRRGCGRRCRRTRRLFATPASPTAAAQWKTSDASASTCITNADAPPPPPAADRRAAFRHVQPAAADRSADTSHARARARRRRDRPGKTTTLAALVNGSTTAGAAHHHRIDRIRAPAPQIDRRADRNRRGRARLSTALRRAPPGARRYRRRRCAIGDDADCRRGRETGHLVFSSLHDRRARPSRASPIPFRSSGRTRRQELAMALAAVLTQTRCRRRLIPAAERCGRLRRAPAGAQERAAAPAPGDYDHAQAGIVHARVADRTGEAGAVDRGRAHPRGPSGGARAAARDVNPSCPASSRSNEPTSNAPCRHRAAHPPRRSEVGSAHPACRASRSSSSSVSARDRSRRAAPSSAC